MTWWPGSTARAAPSDAPKSYGAVEEGCGAGGYAEHLRLKLGLDERFLPADQFERATGVDIDAAFSYETPKYVKLRDARLGCLRVSLWILIAAYVLLYQLLFQGGYLKETYPSGTVDFKLQQRGVSGAGTVCDVSLADDDCLDEGSDAATEAYCTQSPLAYHGRKLLCEQEEYSAVADIQDSSLFATTREITQAQIKVCSIDPDDALYRGGECPHTYATNATREWYVSAIEAFVVSVRHTFRDDDGVISGRSDTVKGRLKSTSDELCSGDRDALRDGRKTNRAPCFVRANHTLSDLGFVSYDEFDLGALLRSDTDFAIDALNADGNGTYREVGATVTVNIEYNNREPWGMPREPAYVYHVTHTKGSTASREVSEYGDYPDDLTLIQSYGVKIDFVLTGTFYTFDFTQGLIRVTTALALFAAAGCVVDFLAVYAMRHRAKYADLIYEESEDFGDLVKAEAEAEAARAM